MRALVVAPAAQAVGRGKQLVESREEDCTDTRYAFDLQGDQHGIERYGLQKGLGTIDRVYDPTEGIARPGFLAELLSDDGMRGVLLFDRLPDECLAGPVRCRNRGLVGFQVMPDAPVVMLQRDSARAPGQLAGKAEIG